MHTNKSDKNSQSKKHKKTKKVKEIGGRKGPEPTRYGDWEKNGRCIDF
tara:strand:- start:1153 stop:1296 length:144 start_codon:yes stop_codon:yes gene_type:complete